MRHKKIQRGDETKGHAHRQPLLRSFFISPSRAEKRKRREREEKGKRKARGREEKEKRERGEETRN